MRDGSLLCGQLKTNRT